MIYCQLSLHLEPVMAVALWWVAPSPPRPHGCHVFLCKSCLDHWLDNADDDPNLEPSALEWL